MMHPFPEPLAVAPNVLLLTSRIPYRFNSYLIGTNLDTLIDTGTRWSLRRLQTQLADYAISTIALTHCHPDHQGSAAALCARYGASLACPEADANAVEGKVPMEPDNLVSRFVVALTRGKFHEVNHRLRDGEKIAGDWRLVHAPGHTSGHSFYYRESDSVVIAGDVLANINFLTGIEYLHAPPFFFSSSVQENRRSVRRLLDLAPSLVLFGHGAPLTGMDRLKKLMD